MRRLIDDYKAEFRHMMEHAPHVPLLMAAVAALYLLAGLLV